MNERWYSVSVSETEKKLNTDSASGLSHAEAKSRLRKFGENTVYASCRRSFAVHIAGATADVSVALLAVALIVSSFFDSGAQSYTALCLLLAALAASVICHLISAHIFEDAAEYSLPRTRVIRGGSVFYVDVRDIVPGDVILLEKGDVVPCDCRLVSSEGLRAIEFVGKISGKEKKELTIKDAGMQCSPDAKLRIAEQKNMISTAAVIASGKGRAVAVRTGSRTFISAVVGLLDPLPPRGRKLTVNENLKKHFARLGLFLLIAVIPVSVASYISTKSTAYVFSAILTLLALAVTSGSELLPSLLSVFSSAAVFKAEKSKNMSRIKFRNTIEEMNYLDSLVLLGDGCLASDEKKIESVFAANRFYDVSTACENARDASFVNFAELAVLGSAYRQKMPSLGSCGVSSYAVIEKLAEDNGIDVKKLLDENRLVEFSPAEVSSYDTTLVKNGDEYRLICISELTSLVGLCTDIRMPSGPIPLENAKKSEIIHTCEQFAKRSKQVAIVASRISPCSSLARLGAVQNQLILEGFIIYADPFTKNCSLRIREMQEAEIAVYYFGEETPGDVITAFNTGVVKSRKEIAYASHFRRAGSQVTDKLGEYRAYLGFSERDLIRLLKAIRGENGTVCVAASETEHLSLMNEANFSVVISDCGENRVKRAETTEKSPEILRRNADALIPPPKKSGKGIESLYEAVLLSKNACCGLAKIIRYLVFAAALRLTVAVPTLIIGKSILTAVQILALGVLVDIPAMLCFSALRSTEVLSDRLEDIESIALSPMRSCAKYAVGGTALGIIVLLMTFVLGSSGIASSEFLSTFALAALLLSHLAAVFIIARFRNGDRKGKTVYFIHLFLSILVLVLGVAVPSLGAALGIAYPGWQICAAAPIVSVIGLVMISVTDRYI